jgi:hypothetical protein
MHYRHEGLGGELANMLEPIEKFLKELGVSAPDPQDSLRISKSSLPEETQVMLLNLTS